MMQQLRAYTERLSATAARVLDAASSMLDSLGFTATNGTTAAFAWNVNRPVHTAICTHGKRYEWRLQEMLT